MVRAPFYDKASGVKKGAWSVEEDNKLRAYIQTQQLAHINWRALPKFAGLSRCGKSCRLRWLNYLRPGVKHGNYTQEEDELIIKLHQQFGNKWSLIAANLEGRTDNEIKNHWHTHIKKLMITEQNPTSSSGVVKDNESYNYDDDSVHHQILESSPLSSETFSSSDSSSMSSNHVPPASSTRNSFNEDGLVSSFEGSGGDFWTEPFQPDNYMHTDTDHANSYFMEEGILLSSPHVTLYDVHDGVDLFFQVMPTLEDNVNE